MSLLKLYSWDNRTIPSSFHGALSTHWASQAITIINSTYGGPAVCYSLYKCLHMRPLLNPYNGFANQELQYHLTEKTEALGENMFCFVF